jgi:hypothetical protein
LDFRPAALVAGDLFPVAVAAEVLVPAADQLQVAARPEPDDFAVVWPVALLVVYYQYLAAADPRVAVLLLSGVVAVVVAAVAFCGDHFSRGFAN